ncbi:MAG: hypothetical protein QJR05_04670 [Thermoanaerobacterium sp.]|nr:hypothetical protein [Thermoanaerobacterium sp.]
MEQDMMNTIKDQVIGKTVIGIKFSDDRFLNIYFEDHTHVKIKAYKDDLSGTDINIKYSDKEE